MAYNQQYGSQQYGNDGYAQPSRQQHMTADEIWAQEAGSNRDLVQGGHKEQYGNGAYYGDDQPKGSSKKKWWWIGGLLLLAAIIAGVVAGVVVSQNNKKNNSNGSSGSSGGSGSGGGKGSGGDFAKDDRLHKVFWGMAYDPEGAVPPMCGAKQAEVTKDIQILSQLTTRLRLYSANCNVTALVMQAIKDTGVDMKVYPAIYVNDDDAIFTYQMNNLTDAISKYGEDMVEGIAVGNEYMLNQVGSSTSGAAYTTALTYLSDRIDRFNTTLQGMGLKKHIPVGTGDAGSVFSVAMAQKVDFFMSNVHPWFGKLPAAEAATWTWSYYDEHNVQVAAQAPNKPNVYLAETGWPTSANETKFETLEGAHASMADLQTFLDSYICQANANGTEYFYFEGFDQPWKAIYGGVEEHWGLFDKDRNLKQPLTIPNCA
ncbi:hypothetical protein Q8F55_008389 [Vanrija albida]|uniref:glucan endo-1,3-beta-D-glucosidase n=1 Tax=Vanrija albida TaxID=181172 RepID=A0ABR3PX44_9TREE